jgi:2,3-bisphosphoglycerate-independent phosphoglycerate mutase
MKQLKKNGNITRKGPVVLIIMDGIGIAENNSGNALFKANTPLLDKLFAEKMLTQLKAHGPAVGLPDEGDMGNSEVGHNAIGAGRVFDQGAKLVNAAIEKGKIYETPVWKNVTAPAASGGGTMHLIGLLSDGNVHSHINHLFSLIDRASSDGVKKLRIHILLDGRDVPQSSAHIYIKQLEDHLDAHKSAGRDYLIASGGGRMVVTMDRYEADWRIVERGWQAHVLGTARPFSSAMEALETLRKEDAAITDQYLPPFTIADDKGPVGPVNDGDSVVFFNFRGDRAIEISRAFTEKKFDKFDRVRVPDIYYAGMMQYDGDLMIPENFLVYPPEIDDTISEYLAAAGVRQYALSETQKFGHVTYFWNGNRSGKFNEETEVYEEITSDRLEFNQRPWMKAAEITDAVIKAVESGEYGFIRLNFPNGDMVGHTGDFDAAVIAAETVNLCLKRILPVIEKTGSIAVIIADHGNMEEMFEKDKKTGEIKKDPATGIPLNKTSHTLNPVPFILYDPDYNNEYIKSELKSPGGLGNIAATLLMLMGYDAPDAYMESLIRYS